MYDENRVLVSSQLITYSASATISGGAGKTSNFLTSDGLTKSGSNTFMFTTVKQVSASAPAIQSATEAPSMNGWDYNATTGELQTVWLESATTNTLIITTVEGIEIEEDSTVVKILITGI